MRTVSELTEVFGLPLIKGRRYISDPSKAPEGVNVQQGKKGGYYYETAPSSRERRESSFAESRAEREQTQSDRTQAHEEYEKEQVIQAAKDEILSQDEGRKKYIKNLSPVGRRAHNLRYGPIRDKYVNSVIQKWPFKGDPPLKEVEQVEKYVKSEKARIKREDKKRAAATDFDSILERISRA
ncbi:MAG: hypothetical protein ACT6FG_00270 [Methanosarcinaceae archaeon]